MRCKSFLTSRLFQAGCDFEVEVLGRCEAPYTGRMDHHAAVALVKKNQPAKKTQTVVAIEREFARHGLPVRFYTAVGSALDIHEGTDGFFEFAGAVVTIDVTLNPKKEIAKADLVVQKSDLDNIPQLVGWIARKLTQKMEAR